MQGNRKNVRRRMRGSTRLIDGLDMTPCSTRRTGPMSLQQPSPLDLLSRPVQVFAVVGHGGAVDDGQQLAHRSLPAEKLLWRHILRGQRRMAGSKQYLRAERWPAQAWCAMLNPYTLQGGASLLPAARASPPPFFGWALQTATATPPHCCGRTFWKGLERSVSTVPGCSKMEATRCLRRSNSSAMHLVSCMHSGAGKRKRAFRQRQAGWQGPGQAVLEWREGRRSRLSMPSAVRACLHPELQSCCPLIERQPSHCEEALEKYLSAASPG